ncbi:short chain dehydrogenase [Lipomyces tetrasporus]|uniref:Short chain dehydrogenase n=1 Tax=Lipomyces tetrasporus TaxID=54092 RepID=A0AAD7VQ00_9ASCO|nr:short chain dehydrogenase [Lipomyces tetrasporus]KAJ8097718.1 short chain dehydrogenase [Lipomyces tetrasporus]
MGSSQPKVAVIIGGTHCIGLSTASLLVAAGWEIPVTGRRTGPIQAAQLHLGPTAKVVQYDLTDLSSPSSLQGAIKQHPSIDLLFLNAGHAHLEPIAAVTEESFDTTFSTNVRGVFFTAQRLTALVKDEGSIVFTTSVANQVGIPGMAVYSAAKAAVRSLVQTFAAELIPRRVRVNAVSPGLVKTPTMSITGSSDEELRGFEEEGVKMTPLGRIASSNEVAKVVAFVGVEGTFSTGGNYG